LGAYFEIRENRTTKELENFFDKAIKDAEETLKTKI